VVTRGQEAAGGPPWWRMRRLDVVHRDASHQA
jgi:hypothetical protein